MEKKSITYVSGNAGKIKELQRLNNDYINFCYTDLDIIEIQGTAEEIAIAKCKAAFNEVTSPVLIEDSSLYFDSLNGLPGPYIKDFMKKLDLCSLARLGDTKYGNTTARAQCIYAYTDSTRTDPILFVGVTFGKIVYPRYTCDNPFGWDPIFQMNGHSRTYAEMTRKNDYSDRGIAFNKFKIFIESKKDYLN